MFGNIARVRAAARALSGRETSARRPCALTIHREPAFTDPAGPTAALSWRSERGLFGRWPDAVRRGALPGLVRATSRKNQARGRERVPSSDPPAVPAAGPRGRWHSEMPQDPAHDRRRPRPEVRAEALAGVTEPGFCGQRPRGSGPDAHRGRRPGRPGVGEVVGLEDQVGGVQRSEQLQPGVRPLDRGVAGGAETAAATERSSPQSSGDVTGDMRTVRTGLRRGHRDRARRPVPSAAIMKCGFRSS